MPQGHFAASSVLHRGPRLLPRGLSGSARSNVRGTQEMIHVATWRVPAWSTVEYTRHKRMGIAVLNNKEKARLQER